MLCWVGGKYKQARWIIAHFPRDFRRRKYVEPFGGAGWVLFFKPRSREEIYNDINGDLVHLFRTIRDNYEEFERRIRWTLYSREEWNRCKRREFRDEVDRAVCFAVVITQSFGAKGQDFAAGRRTWMGFVHRLEQIRERLQGVCIENLDYREVIRKYDGKNTLFYLDPPYEMGVNDLYGMRWTEEDTRELIEIVKGIKGYWLMSNYRTPLLEEELGDYNWYSYNLKIAMVNSKPVKEEVLITNVPEREMVGPTLDLWGGEE